MGIMPSPLGVLPYVGIKVVGYSAFGLFLVRRAKKLSAPLGEREVVAPRPLALGVTRAIVGLMAGGVYALVLSRDVVDFSIPVLFISLAPLRFIEWLVVILILFPPELRSRRFVFLGSLIGMLVSYVLDLPGIGIWWLLPGVPVC